MKDTCAIDFSSLFFLLTHVFSLLKQSQYFNMPKQITDIRDFLQKARREDAKLVKIRKRSNQTKF